MPGLIHLDTSSYIHFFLVVIRVGSLFAVAPIFSSNRIPLMIRLQLVLVFSLLIFSFLPPITVRLNVPITSYLFLVWKEVFVGFAIGGIARIVFAAIDIAGEIISFQMGLTIANVLDPTQGSQVSLVSSFESMFASLLFLLINGHYILFETIATSYKLFPIGKAFFHKEAIETYIHTMGTMFTLAVRFSAPLVITLLLANLIMGIMARSMPQMNVFLVGAPFMLLLGLVMLLIHMPYLYLVLKKELITNIEDMLKAVFYVRAKVT